MTNEFKMILGCLFVEWPWEYYDTWYGEEHISHGNYSVSESDCLELRLLVSACNRKSLPVISFDSSHRKILQGF